MGLLKRDTQAAPLTDQIKAVIEPPRVGGTEVVTAGKLPAVSNPVPSSGQLSAKEREDFSKLREVVRKGLGTFVAVGKALGHIRDEKLYRETHDTFEAFLAGEWDMSKAHASRQISAAALVGTLASIGAVPLSETQVRPLTKLKPELAKECWRRAVESAPRGSDGQPRITAEQVKAVVVKMSPKRQPKASRKAKKLRPVTIKTEHGVVKISLRKGGAVGECLKAAFEQYREQAAKRKAA